MTVSSGCVVKIVIVLLLPVRQGGEGGGGYVLIGLSDQPEQLISGGIRSNREWSAFDRLVWRTSCPGVDGGRRVQ